MRIPVNRRMFVKGLMGLVSFVGVAKYLTVDRVSTALGGELPEDIPPVPPDEPIANFLKGSVLSFTATGFVGETRHGRRVVELQGASIWKKDFVPSLPIEVGDIFTAWGEPQDDDSYVAEKIWFNIFNVRGVVSNIRSADGEASFDLTGGRHDASIRADASALLNTEEAERMFDPADVPFSEGQGVQVIGVRTSDGMIATRIFA
ncbi:MAG: hypothetical protein IID41_14095 [Planctomycetes bacterium]|nr:hypothetical protein [Planctomycetota bacterium]